jgi:GAF domain-containing protein/HAMP domain-containing protein
MVITRKLILPTLALFAVLLIGLVGYLAFNASSTLENEENRRLVNLAQVFQQDLEGRSAVALALAKQVAGNPEVVQSIAEDDRLRLINLTLNAFKSVQPLYDLTQQQYVDEPAKVILRLQNINRYGDDLSANRPTLVSAIQNKADVSGLELAEDGLSLRGVAPFEAGQDTSAVDIAMALNQKSLEALQQKYGSQWQIFLDDAARQAVKYTSSIGPINPSEPRLRLLASTLIQPIYSSPEAYQRAMTGETIVQRTADGENTYAILSLPLRDYSGRIIGVVDILADRSEQMAAQRNRLMLTILAGLGGLLLGGLLISFITRRTLAPIKPLTDVALSFAAGDLSASTPASLEARLKKHRKPDEIDLLAQAFVAMATQLRRLVGNLEDRVAERTLNLERRTGQLRAVADIARDITMLTDLQALLEQAVQLVRQRFDFYHAGVFLLDESGEYAVVRAATGDSGRRMVENGHRLRVGRGEQGDPVGIVGSACGSGQPHLSQDVTLDPSYFKNPFLPDTRSEMALPLRLAAYTERNPAGEPRTNTPRVIGVLDVQSTRPNAFDEGDITVLQLLADQIAIALNNARLIQELNNSMQELEQAYRAMTQQTWSVYTRQKPQAIGFRYNPGVNRSGEASFDVDRIPAEIAQNIHPISVSEVAALFDQDLIDSNQDGDAGARPDGTKNLPTGDQAQNLEGAVLSVPVRLRGQQIGMIRLRFDPASLPGSENIPADLAELVNEVGARLGLVLESTRLLHEAQRLAAREQQINRIAGEMRGSVDLEAILQSTVRELGRALGARRTYIQLGEFSDQPTRSGESKHG